ncbi:MAG TPA: hypothetical protein VM142_07400, partial [Acidimicrobiales bacterium]|nr:hypothetical protein [Acidimicrobiales bacterium]
MTKDQSNRPLRLGKLRGGGMRPWQTKLYGPTPARPRPRVVYKDLETGEWRYLSGEDMEEANAIFDKAERWLDAGVTLTAEKQETAGAKRDIAALGKRLLTRMEDDGVRRRTLQDWERMATVRYRAKARHQGQVASFVPLNDRPTTPAVRDLCAALYWRGRRQDRW